MNQYQLPPDLKCPACGGAADDKTAVTTATSPAPGDIAVCFYCSSINQYYADGDLLRLSVMSNEDLQQIKRENLRTYNYLLNARWSIQMAHSD